MFDSIGWGEVLVLVLAGLFILGPERLPAAAAWLGKTLRQVRECATGAQEQLRSELGGEFDELRKPLQDLQGIRTADPRTIVIQHVFDGNNPLEAATNDPGSGDGPPRQSDTSHPDSGEHSLQAESPPFDADTT